MDSADDGAPLCRYCFEEESDGEEGQLISPCGCRGGQRYCHLGCLRRWQEHTLSDRVPHPLLRDDRPSRCNVCRQFFDVPPPTRYELVRKLAGGSIARLLKRGSLLVTSDDVEPGSPECRHWARAVYMVVRVVPAPDRRGDNDLMAAVNLSHRMDPAVLSEELVDAVGVCLGRHRARVLVKHFDGGPGDLATGAAAALHATPVEEVPCFSGVEVGGTEPRLWVVGSLSSVAAIAAFDHARRGDGAPKAEVNCYWGGMVARRVQILGELAKGRWGMGSAQFRDVFSGCDGSLWERLTGSDRIEYAPRGAMSVDYGSGSG